MLEEAKLECGGVTITPDLLDVMEKMTVTIFEVLEQVWKTKVREQFELCALKVSVLSATMTMSVRSGSTSLSQLGE